MLRFTINLYDNVQGILVAYPYLEIQTFHISIMPLKNRTFFILEVLLCFGMCSV